ncbi:hypothetical protein GCM10027055_01060 [Janibacter alkaliphilus]|uniref:Uncharacterized protein n=1 Tax=Janibacter alkaliphilus TaxID=1069963 RepID=A0A852XE31_9MICO|nr:hypothetical protein [Janibacter alkaliphilus]NYG36721.1 hypothetical protein [Janibacter alkaliphilus]
MGQQRGEGEMQIDVAAGERLTLTMDDDGRRFLRANILEAIAELGEGEYATRTGFSIEQGRAVADALRPSP